MNKVVAEKLRVELERLRNEREALANQILGIEKALALLEGGGAEPPTTSVPSVQSEPKRPRMQIKDAVLGLIIERAETGLNAAGVLSAAAAQGLSLDRNSVSSLLSRLKREGVLDYDGSVYRPASPGGGGNNVAPLPRHAA
jgi:hypothetical protein